MKEAFFKIFLSGLLLVVGVGCSQPTDSSNNSNGSTAATQELEAKKKIYTELKGTYETDRNVRGNYDFNNLIILDTFIQLGSIPYPINIEKDIKTCKEAAAENPNFWYDATDPDYLIENTFVVTLDDIVYLFSKTMYTYQNANIISVSDETGEGDARRFKKVSTGSGSGSIAFDIEGTWKQKSDTTDRYINLNEGGSFDVYKNGTKQPYSDCTYTVNGNQITLSYTNITNALTTKTTDTFTVSGSASEMTWTLVKSITDVAGDKTEDTSQSALILQFWQKEESTSITLKK